MTIQEIITQIKGLVPTPPSDEAIKSSVVNVFADMMSRADFYFMRAPDPTAATSFVADDYEYDVTINGCEKIVSVAVMGSGETDYTDILYAMPETFRKIKSGDLVPPGSWWTVTALKQPDVFRIQFYPTPDSSSGVFRATYQLRADANTITRLPNRWLRVLLHGAMADLGRNMGENVNLMSIYEDGLRRMVAREQIVSEYLPPYEVNDYDADRNAELVDLQ